MRMKVGFYSLKVSYVVDFLMACVKPGAHCFCQTGCPATPLLHLPVSASTIVAATGVGRHTPGFLSMLGISHLRARTAGIYFTTELPSLSLQ